MTQTLHQRADSYISRHGVVADGFPVGNRKCIRRSYLRLKLIAEFIFDLDDHRIDFLRSKAVHQLKVVLLFLQVMLHIEMNCPVSQSGSVRNLAHRRSEEHTSELQSRE